MSGRPKAMPSPEAPWLAAGSGTKVPSFVGRPPGRNAKAGTGLWPHVLAPLIVVPPGAPENEKNPAEAGALGSSGTKKTTESWRGHHGWQR